jgi:hypothetical protein
MHCRRQRQTNLLNQRHRPLNVKGAMPPCGQGGVIETSQVLLTPGGRLGENRLFQDDTADDSDAETEITHRRHGTVKSTQSPWSETGSGSRLFGRVGTALGRTIQTSPEMIRALIWTSWWS